MYTFGGRDSKNFELFVNLCCEAYNLIRKNADLFLGLLLIMLQTGIPQLTKIEDLDYIRDSLSLDLTDEEASEKFKKLIDESINTKMSVINNSFHSLVN